MVKKNSSTGFRPKASPLRYTRSIPPAAAAVPPNASNSSGRPSPRLMPILIGGGLLYITATYVSMSVFKSKSDTASHTHDHSTQDDPLDNSFDTAPVWENLAKQYDKEIDWDEFVMGIGLMRRWLIGQAKGDVLEVSTGTGRNFKYYNGDQLSSATFTDRNAGMLAEAKDKFAQYADQFKKTFTDFKQANVDNVQSMTTENGQRQQFDTVVDTFGLCSCKDPEQALISLADACKPSDESRILLLEHGRSHYDWLNRILDTNVDKHVRRWGCWWNRDLMTLFEREKVKEKLEIVKVYRWHLGTTCYIVAKPKVQQQQEQSITSSSSTPSSPSA